MQRKKSDIVNLVYYIIIAFFVVFLTWKAYSGATYYGEIDSNALPVISLQYRGSIFVQQSDIEQAQKDFPNLYKGILGYEDLRYSKLLKVTEDSWMSYYFPIYPLVCIPAKLVLAFIGANQERCFEITNALLIILGFWFVLKKLQAKPAQRLLTVFLLALSPAVWYYINYICYEAFIFSMLTISLVQYSNKKYKSSAFVLALGGMSNSAVMAVGIVMVCEYLGKMIHQKKGINFSAVIRNNFTEMVLYGLCYIPCLIPFLVQRIYLKTSIYRITSGGMQGAVGRAFAYFFDPNLGICSFAPLVLIVFLAMVLFSVVKKHYQTLTWFFFLVGTVVAVSFMPHINCGMLYCARYVAWIYPIIPIFLTTVGYEMLPQMWGRMLCYGLMVISCMFFLYWNHGVKLYHFNNCAEWLLNYVPNLYNPLNSTFYCRVFHVDGGYSYTEPAYHKNKKTDEITKLIYRADPGVEDLILDDVTGDKDSLQYLEREIERQGEDGKFHYINLPVWGKYEIYERNLAQKENLTERNILLDKSDFCLDRKNGKQKKRFKINVKNNTVYKVELQLAEGFDFRAVDDLIVDFRRKSDMNPHLRVNAFLAKGRYDYTFYFKTEMSESPTFEITAKIVLQTEFDRMISERIKKFRVTEMQKK